MSCEELESDPLVRRKFWWSEPNKHRDFHGKVQVNFEQEGAAEHGRKEAKQRCDEEKFNVARAPPRTAKSGCATEECFGAWANRG